MSDRRQEIGLTQVQAAAACEASLAAWSVIENARQETDAMTQRTLREVAKALRWPADALERILAGEQPGPAWEVAVSGDGLSVVQAIANDPELDDAGRQLVVAAYLAARQARLR